MSNSNGIAYVPPTQPTPNDKTNKNKIKQHEVTVTNQVHHIPKTSQQHVTAMIKDADDFTNRIGNRSPWASPNSRVGEIRTVEGEGNPTPIENRTYVCAMRVQPKIEHEECQIILVTCVKNEMYVCAVRSGIDFTQCDPLKISMHSNETPIHAATRLGASFFPGIKTVQRAIIRTTSKPPTEISYVSKYGQSTQASQWGVWLSSRVALNLPAPLIPGSTIHTDELAENPKAVWMQTRDFLDTMRALPYNGAVAKSAAKWIAEFATDNDMPIEDQCQPSKTQAQLESPTEITAWHKQMNETTLNFDKAVANENVSFVGWSIGDIPSPYMHNDTLPRLVATIQRLPQAACGQKQLQQVVDAARGRAQGHGCQVISARDLIEAAQAIRYEDRHHAPRPAPAQMPPQHYPELRRAIARIAETIEKDENRGIGRPWVLVCCERSAIIALQFKLAGCQVATADLEATKDPSIPHFKGDARLITHLGFDLIIATLPVRTCATRA